MGHAGIDDEPQDRPDTIGLVRVDGADTVLMHRLIDMERPAIGTRVTVRLRGDRSGSIQDIEGFGPEEA